MGLVDNCASRCYNYTQVQRIEPLTYELEERYI